MNSENPIEIRIIFLSKNKVSGIIEFRIFIVITINTVKKLIIKNSPKENLKVTTFDISYKFITRPIKAEAAIAIPYPIILIDGIPIKIKIKTSCIKEVIIEFISITFCLPSPFSIP